MRDYQRQKVYMWENEYIHKGNPEHIPLEYIQPIVDYVWEKETKEEWFAPPKVKELPKSKTCAGDATRLAIRFPKRGATINVILHEIAHSLTSDFEGKSAAHGPRFVGVYIRLLVKYSCFDLHFLNYTAQKCGVKFNSKGIIV